MKLNFGSGESKLEGFINCDIFSGSKPDVVCDLKFDLPFKNESMDEIFLIHVIEHIEKGYHMFILKEFNRVLKPSGTVLFAFPEFKEIAQRWIDNSGGQRDWWEKTIFGRQAWKGDYHVCAMNHDELIYMLSMCGFGKVRSKPESDSEPYNTLIVAVKEGKYTERQEIFKKEIFEN